MAKDMKPRDYEAALATAQSIIQAQAERINELVAMVEELTDKLENLEDAEPEKAQDKAAPEAVKVPKDSVEKAAEQYFERMARSRTSPVGWSPDEGRSRVMVIVEERFDKRCFEVAVALKGLPGEAKHVLGVHALDEQAQMSIRRYLGRERDYYLAEMSRRIADSIAAEARLSQQQAAVIFEKLSETLSKKFKGF